MAAENSSAVTKLNSITECCICLKKFTDPRMLPCIHTFCLQCLKNLTEQLKKKPGNSLPCPVCRTKFTIPKVGVQGLQKNFFMAGVIEVSNTLSLPKDVALPCIICKVNHLSLMGKIPVASNRCSVCHEDCCERCCKMHKSSKVSKDHEVLKIGGNAGDEISVKKIQMLNCDIHQGNLLDCYCSECKKVVCFSCVAESHKTHDCKDVRTVEEEFRKIMESSSHVISVLAGDLSQKKQKLESKEDFLKKIAEKKEEILQRSKELKEMIEEHTKSVLCSLFDLKKRHLKEIQTDVKEIDRRVILLESFSSYCDELRLKGSDSEVCGSKDELLLKANELEEDHKMYIKDWSVPFDVNFRVTQWENFLKTADGNVVGSVRENVEDLNGFVIAIAQNDDTWYHSDSYKISLPGCSEIVSPMDVPTTVNSDAAAAVYNNTMFITGIGKFRNEIWKYNFASGWNKCGSLALRRHHHCAEFIGDTLFICGGYDGHHVLNTIEAYNSTTKKTAVVGLLRFGFQRAASVVYKDSLYVFGGLGITGRLLDVVQVYSPFGDYPTSTILQTAMPDSSVFMRAVLWDRYAILVGRETCLIFDFEGKTWLERPRFRADASSFGMVLDTERIFVIGGLPRKVCHRSKSDFEGVGHVRCISASSIVTNKARKWQTYCKLPKEFHVAAFAKLDLPCNVKPDSALVENPT